ncbi:DUF2292 domain-containing protein [Anaerophilus nitritogenes]|nr:DUF2292 domain-containing protein [Anaerophilus nitritogenes]
MGARYKIEVDEKEKKLIDWIRKIGYGELRVIIQENLPIRIEEVKKSIKL